MSAHTNEKERGWLLPAGRKSAGTGGLHIVATPIGNLGDITLRALDVLSAADLIVCEDTRVSGKLLSFYGIKKPLLPYNDHNATRQRGPILDKLKAGQAVALISDAGMPLINDPGYKLVEACIAENIPVTSLPGANAVLTALQLSGLPSDAFYFGGYLPVKDAARKKALQPLKDIQATLIFFETAPRLEKALETIREVLGDRDIAIARELTKMFENVKRVKVSAALDVYKKEGPPKGEIVLLIGSRPIAPAADADLEKLLKQALKSMSTKEASAAVAKQTGKPRKLLYEMALEIAKK